METQVMAEAIKVLVVEDNLGDFKLLELALKDLDRNDFRLLHETKLQDALRRASQEEIDAILLDLFLPDAQGLDTLIQLQEADPVTPIIVLTGLGDEELALRALRLGAQEFLVKDNLTGTTLARTLRHSVERNRFGLLRKIELMRDEISTPAGPRRTPKGPSETNCNDLAAILDQGSVQAHFQPWVSLKKQTIVGFEGLCRGVEQEGGILISPTALLRMAGRWKLLSELDRLFRRKVLEEFRTLHKENPEWVLSVNFDASILNEKAEEADDFSLLAHELGLDPGHIAIEILESRTHDLQRLKRFIEIQRSNGFLIALDDVGSGYSSLERIAELKPDLIKTDRSLVMDIDQSYHRQEVFKSIVKLAHSIGALLVAEGTETETEAMMACELGCDLIQGYYFAKPGPVGADFLGNCQERIDGAVREFKRYIIRNINAKRDHYQRYDRMISSIIQDLSTATPKQFDSKLTDVLRLYPETKCLYVLDEGGTQMSRMISHEIPGNAKVFFKPAERGSDHSLKEYYYYLMEISHKDYTYVTEPYLSMSTGKRCVTISSLFKDAYGHANILCLDVDPL